jgi:6-phosphogluconolactonase
VENIQTESHPFFVGTYTNSESKGIYKYALNNDGTIEYIGLSAITENPSFLAYSADRRFLVAVQETDVDGKGAVKSFRVDKDSLIFISQSSSGGAHPCFVGVNKNGNVLAANYTSGNVGLLHLDENGKLDSLLDVQQHLGSGSTERQKEPHAHSVWFEPTDDSSIISVDLGTNQLWFSKIDEAQNLVPSDPLTLTMADGAGPRHLTFHPNGKWIYVLNELNNTITLVNKSNNDYEIAPSVATLPEDFTEFSKAADIHITSDGKFVYASNRGHESIAMFEVDKSKGTLLPIGYQEVKGKEPRNFSLSPNDKYLIVANQYTNNLVSFKRDSTTGLLTYVSEIKAPTPVCILF